MFTGSLGRCDESFGLAESSLLTVSYYPSYIIQISGMLAKVSKRINEILQTQDHPDILTSPKNRKGTNEEHFLKTYAGSIEAIDRVNFSERKERPSHSNKQPLPPKSSNNLAYNSAAKSDKEPDNRSRRSIDRTMSVQQQPESALSAQMFVSLYKEEILAFIRPLLADLEEKVLRRIESVEKALRSVSDLQKFSPVLMAPTPNFSTPNKAPLTI